MKIWPWILWVFLVACTPITVVRKADIPITQKCKITPVKIRSLPTSEEIPMGLSKKAKRIWILSALYGDIVLQEGEIQALQAAGKGCE